MSSKSKTRKKPKWRVMRFRKNDPAHNLQTAVVHWIKANGGTAIVIGGIEVQQWPGDGEFNYRVAVRATGKKPEAVKAAA
jgi:hypothetical protein